MKTLIIIITLLAIPSIALASNSCFGLPPVKPIPPIGCDDMIAICQNGRWVWVCVAY